MATYIQTDETGAILAHADWAFPGSTEVNYEVVRGWDGKLYKSGEEPAKPEATTEELFTALRAARDARLAATDTYLLADYPISADNLVLVKAYRADLRALPEQPGAPWDGGGELTPWPEKPNF